MIPDAEQLSISKLRNANLMTDTCSTARKHRRMWAKEVKDEARKLGLSEDDMIVFEGDCWHHLRNVWFGAVIVQLSKTLNEILASDLDEIPAVLRVKTKTNVTELLRAIEKEFARTANYAKGHGDMFFDWMRRYHPSVLLLPIARALGGSRQDIGVEGAPAVYMNLPYFLEFLNWRLACGVHDNILQKCLFIVLRSVEMIAMMRVLSILHIAVCLPTRWLAGNTHQLAEYDFGYYDMSRVVNMLEEAMEEVAEDGSKMLDEDFMMSIFSDIMEQVEPFQAYLDYIFEEKLSYPVGSHNKDDAQLPFDLLRAELFYPERVENRQTHGISCRLAQEIAITILTELRDPKKATSAYLSSIDGIYSWYNVSDEMKEAGKNKMANNSVSESNHASSTQGLKTSGTIRIDHSAGEGQSRYNNDFGRGHQALITGKQSKSGPVEKADLIGSFHNLPGDLQESLIQFSRENAVKTRKAFDDALEKQRAKARRKEEIRMELGLKVAQSEFIVAIYFHEQYHSPRCWNTVDKATEQYNKLTSRTKKLEAVKEQILIRYLGLGWDKAHHPWSRGEVIYGPDELFKHLVETVIPLADVEKIPDEPPLNMPSPPEMHALGTTANVGLNLQNNNAADIAKMRAEGYKERDRREAAGDGDRWGEMQEFTAPDIDQDLVGFQLEKLFEYTEPDGSTMLEWCHGEIIAIKNAKTNTVKVAWDPQFVRTKDERETNEKLLPTKWNPKGKHTKGAWREYLKE
jgi:hypothetical protein